MTWYDWLIVIFPVAGIMFTGWYIRRYIVGVSDYLVAGRLCRRYVISTAGMANMLGLVTLASFVEVSYKTGFALSFWNNLMLPIGIMISLSGYCLYRFRETRAMSLGQFLEMRYGRSLRIFSCFLRSIAEMMANVIMPAIAARFFISYLDLPHSFNIIGWQCPTFLLIVFILLTLALTLICMGGTLSIIVTDTIQGLMFYPLTLTFIIFVLVKFSWPNEIVQVMADRASGESFLNPYDISNLRDFNLFMVFVTFIGMFLHTASGVSGQSNAAISAHESKMASILGTWRGAFTVIFYTVFAIAIITIMSHKNFADDARNIRMSMTKKIASELIENPAERADFMKVMESIPPVRHEMGKEKPFSEKENPDELYFNVAQTQFGSDGEGSSKTQQFKTIFRQMMLPEAMRHMLPPVLAGLFALMIIMFIISTDVCRIYSASSTLAQDCVVPFYKNESLTPSRHIFLIRMLSIGVGIFFLFGSFFMAQLDYINLFVQVMYGMWLGGCGPMIVFGFYSRFGTTAGAWTSLLSGMGINLGGILLQRNWADAIYPWLNEMDWTEPVGSFLATVSGPFNPYVVWEMNSLKFPINSYEIYFLAMMFSLISYFVVSAVTCRAPFNLERMLHRGKYATGDTAKNIKSTWTWKTVWSKLIGITPEYSTGDKIIAWSVFSYSILYKFFIAFVLVILCNMISPWPLKWWGNYFLVVSLVIPGIAAAITTVWFGIGSTVDLARMFHDLQNRVANPLDNGMVEGHISLSEKAEMEAIDRNNKTKEDTK